MGRRPTPYVSDTERKITELGLRDSSARLLPPGSVILSSRAPIGHLVINTLPMATNQGCKGLVPSEGLDAKYLYYYLSSIVDLLNDLGSGATFKELSGGKLKQVRIPISPLSEQQRIVAILDETFDGIATAKANAEKNLANANDVFVSKLSSTFVRRDDEVSLCELASEITDGDHSPPPKADSGIPFVTISDINRFTREIDFGETFYVSGEYFHKLKESKKPKVGDVLYTVTGATLGVPVLIKKQRDLCFQRHIGLIRPNGRADSTWLAYALLSPQSYQQAVDGSTGAAQKTVSLRVLRDMKVPKLAVPEQRRIARELDVLFVETCRLADLYTRKIAFLDDLKKSLLHHAFSGQL
jgi:type I restriction enzyme, S subunit